MGLFRRKKKEPKPGKRPYCAAIVPAAGLSSRMGGGSKPFADLCGAPVLAHTLTALQHSTAVDEIIIAAKGEEIAGIYDICKHFGIAKATKVIRGGDTRQQSVLTALGEVPAKAQLVAVHDGARPLASSADIDRVVETAATFGAAILAVPLKDTIKEVADGIVKHTPDRCRFWAVQTPQVFDRLLLSGALSKAQAANIDLTDDAGAVERLGVPVQIVEGSYDNIKITTPHDLVMAAGLLEANHEDRARV